MGGWPTAADLDAAAPGRRVALWAHDHHALWVSSLALAAAGIGAGTPDPDGGFLRRDADGRPTGLLHEAATALLAAAIPAPDADAIARAVPHLVARLHALGIVAVHDPGMIRPDPRLERAWVAYQALDEAGDLAIRLHACLRNDGLATAAARGLRSGDPLGSGDDALVRVGWQKLFADGTLGSRTAALLEPIEREPDRPVPAGQDRGVWVTPPAELARLAADAAGAGIASQIHAIGDAAVRAALDALAPHADRTPLMPRVEHVQLVHPDDRPRFGRLRIAASVQPVHLRSDAATARRTWGERAESGGYAWGTLAAAGAVLAFGTDAPVEPIDPWPGIALAVLRRDPSWGEAALPFGAPEALSLASALRAACVGPAISAGEHDRGRLVAGQRADFIVLPAAPAEVAEAAAAGFAAVRPRLTALGGEIVHEA